jgi:predicted nucleotidyltransferase
MSTNTASAKEAKMPGPLVLDREAIGELCRRYGVRSLVLFGSALTNHFDQSRSDVDFLVEFAHDLPNKFDAYFGLKESLEELLGRPVDLVMSKALENPYFAASALRHTEELYAA